MKRTYKGFGDSESSRSLQDTVIDSITSSTSLGRTQATQHLIAASNVWHEEIDRIHETRGSLELSKQKQDMPMLNQFASGILTGQKSALIPPLLCWNMLSIFEKQIAGHDPVAAIHYINQFVAAEDYLYNCSLPVLISGESVDAAQSIGIELTSQIELLKAAKDVPFYFYVRDLPKGIRPEGLTSEDALISVKIKQMQPCEITLPDSDNSVFVALDDDFCWRNYWLLNNSFIRLRKANFEAAMSLVHQYAKGFKEAVPSSAEEMSSLLKKVAVLNATLLQLKTGHAQPYTNKPPESELLKVQISVTGGYERGVGVGLSVYNLERSLNPDHTHATHFKEEFNLQRGLLNIIAVEIATSGTYNSLVHEHTLSSTPQPQPQISKRKQKKLKQQQKLKGAMATKVVPMKRYGNEAVLAVRHSSSSEEWQGKTLQTIHWRRPHMSTRYIGRGPNKKKTQVLVKGTLVTGEAARKKREKQLRSVHQAPQRF